MQEEPELNNQSEQDQVNKTRDTVDPQKVDMYILANRKYFPANRLLYLKNKMLEVSDTKFEMVSVCDLKSPGLILVVSLVIGGIGVDRFMIGDIGMGVLKLLTGSLFGVLWVYDVLTIANRVKRINFESVMLLL